MGDTISFECLEARTLSITLYGLNAINVESTRPRVLYALSGLADRL